VCGVCGVCVVERGCGISEGGGGCGYEGWVGVVVVVVVVVVEGIVYIRSGHVICMVFRTFRDTILRGSCCIVAVVVYHVQKH
jgi:hypothetical protein